MKKLLISLLLILAVLVACTYIFIPSKISIVAASNIAASESSTGRFLFDSSKWEKWWAMKDSAGNGLAFKNGVFASNNDEFRVTKIAHMSADVNINHDREILPSQLLLIAKSNDTCLIQWRCSLDAGINPVTRFTQYQKAIAIKKNMDKVISHFRGFAENPENIYGMRLVRSTFKDTLLISKKSVYTIHPNTQAIYDQVILLQSYITKNGAQQSGNPIYNVTQLDDTHYQLMTAVPVNKVLKGDPVYSFKRMIPGSFIVAEVKGGEQAIENGSNNLDLFFSDYSKTSMAMNFRMLVTNRLETPDSTRWVTRLYHPVY